MSFRNNWLTFIFGFLLFFFLENFGSKSLLISSLKVKLWLQVGQLKFRCLLGDHICADLLEQSS